jgi:hypothetical protein
MQKHNQNLGRTMPTHDLNVGQTLSETLQNGTKHDLNVGQTLLEPSQNNAKT